MHIAYVIAPGGGPDAYVRAIAPALVRCGHHVSVVYTASADKIKELFPSSIRVRFAPTTSAHYYLYRLVNNTGDLPRRLRAWEEAISVYRSLAAIDRQEKIDLVEVTEEMPLAFLNRRWRTIVRAHGSDWSFHHFCGDGDLRQDRWRIAAESKQLAQANAVSALSQHLAEHLSAFCNFPLERITVIPYPIDLAEFSADDRNRNPNDAPTLLTIGRLEKRKGTHYLMQALPQVWRKFPNAQVYLLGSEGDLTKLDLLVLVPENKRDQIIFPGFVGREQIVDFFRRADLYVTPTQYETFGYTVLEAMACGLPVIASDVGAIPELVNDGVTGLLVPAKNPERLADAIIELLANPQRRLQMGKQGRDQATAFDLEKILAQMIAFYESV